MEVTCIVSSLITQIIHNRKTTCLILCRYLSLVLPNHLWLVDSRPLNVFWRQQVIDWVGIIFSVIIKWLKFLTWWLKSCLAHSMQSLVARKKAYSPIGWQWFLKVYGWWWWWCGTKIFQVVVFFPCLSPDMLTCPAVILSELCLIAAARMFQDVPFLILRWIFSISRSITLFTVWCGL